MKRTWEFFRRETVLIPCGLPYKWQRRPTDSINKLFFVGVYTVANIHSFFLINKEFGKKKQKTVGFFVPLQPKSEKTIKVIRKSVNRKYTRCLRFQSEE
jgi:hypothetical protein